MDPVKYCVNLSVKSKIVAVLPVNNQNNTLLTSFIISILPIVDTRNPFRIIQFP